MNNQNPQGPYVTIAENRHTNIVAVDKVGPGNTRHFYWIQDRDGKNLAYLPFQFGPVSENGVNGIQLEDLLQICVDRLEGFQSGRHLCRENAIAITKIQEALMWLNHRTAQRIKRGVEGTSAV